MATRVSDSTPLIAFARIGRLQLLREIVDRLEVPEAVWEELVGARERSGAVEILRADWIVVRAVLNVPPTLLVTLDRGESEVIALAEQLRAEEVLLDERAARALALSRGLRVTGTIGLLVRAKERRLIPEVRPVAEEMRRRGIRYGERFLAEVFRLVGE